MQFFLILGRVANKKKRFTKMLSYNNLCEIRYFKLQYHNIISYVHLLSFKM